MTGTRYIVDTNIWVDYFWHGRFVEEISHAELETPAVVLVELAGYFIRNGVPREFSVRCIAEIVRRSAILNFDMERALKVVEIREKLGLPAMDAIIYSYAENGKILLTRDADLKGLSDVDYRKK